MDEISPTELKSILHSKRANIYYLQHCRVLVNGGRVEYITDEGKQSLYWNIPIANTTTVLLGTGTSITQAAMRELAKAGVLVGFCGGGGTPLFSANEIDVDVAWFTPQSEYRPTEYLQAWVRFWFDDALRVAAAKAFQLQRLQRVQQAWLQNRALTDAGFEVDSNQLRQRLERSAQAIGIATDTSDLLTEEARLTKVLFRLAAQAMHYGDFTRSNVARAPIRPTVSSTMATIWPTAWARPLPGSWDYRMAWPCCTAKLEEADLFSMLPIWSKTQ